MCPPDRAARPVARGYASGEGRGRTTVPLGSCEKLRPLCREAFTPPDPDDDDEEEEKEEEEEEDDEDEEEDEEDEDEAAGAASIRRSQQCSDDVGCGTWWRSGASSKRGITT